MSETLVRRWGSEMDSCPAPPLNKPTFHALAPTQGQIG